MKKIGLGTLVVLALLMQITTVSAQSEPSDKVVKFLSNIAFLQMPARIKYSETEIVEFDKSDRSKSEIPNEVARRIVKVGYNTGRAQNCGMQAYEIANYQALMREHRLQKKFTKTQMGFISSLHLVTVMMKAGQIDVSSGAVKKPAAKPAKKSCPENIQAQIRKDIESYVNDVKKRFPRKS